MRKKFLQIIYDLRTQPLIGIVTIGGTALSVFLIMVVVMIQQIYCLPIEPETHRDRMLYGMYLHIQAENYDCSGGLCYDIARELYDGLDGIELTAFQNVGTSQEVAEGTSGERYVVESRCTDDNFWRLYDHKLLSGRTISAADVSSGAKVAVLTDATARRLFNSGDVVGQHVSIGFDDYEVIGTVADHSRLASSAYGEIFTPVSILPTWEDYFGDIMAAMLLKPGVSEEHIRDQVKGRYAQLTTRLSADGKEAVYHGTPFPQEVVTVDFFGSNNDPDLNSGRTGRIITYIVLLLIPAINLSSMLNSRLRHRISDFGIRRAFGCTRRRIIGDILVENLLVTAAGGIIGMICGILFTRFYDGLFINDYGISIHPDLSTLLDWRIILVAVAVCFILNLLSASVPAWIASRRNPAEAINSNKR